MKKTASKNKIASFVVEFDREEDGRWIAEVISLPGVMAYGATRKDAFRYVSAIALRTLADKVEFGKPVPSPVSRLFEYEMVGR